MKSLNRLIYTITKGNKPNDTDVQALNEIIQYVNQEKQRQLENNHLFAKLVTSVLRNDILRNGGNYQLAVESLKSVCRIDLEASLEGFIMEINQLDIEKHLELYKGDLDQFNYPRYNVDKMKERTKEIITNLIEDYETR